MTHAIALLLTSLSLFATPLVIAQPGTHPPAAKSEGAKNVLLIFADDQSYHLGAFGTPGIQTPHLDALARRGVIFSRAFAPAAVCSPSRAALLSGTFPHSNGLWQNTEDSGLNFPALNERKAHPKPVRSRIPEDLPTLTEILREHGVYCAISQKSHVQPIWKFPFDKGVTVSNSPDGFARGMREIIEASGDRPFFFMANIAAPHLPFRAHLKDNNRMDAQGNATGIDPQKIEVLPWLPDTPEMRRDLANYYACIEIVDACAGALIDELAKQGKFNDTLVIFSADNGMGYHRAKTSAYAAGLRVPLIIGGPGVVGGRIVQTPVSLIDLMPTILAFENAPIPETAQGASLWPVLSGKSTSIPGRDTIMAAENEHYLARAVCNGRYYYIRNFDKPKGGWANPPMNLDLWKKGPPWFNEAFTITVNAKESHPEAYGHLAQLVESRMPDEELFDLDKDPWCVNNLANDLAMKPVLERLREELAKWREKTNDVDTRAELSARFPAYPNRQP